MAREIIPELDVNRAHQVQLLIQFMDVLSRGLVKPYDPTHVVKKLDELKKAGIDTSWAEQCCPPSSEVRDVIEVKGWYFAAAERISEILNI